MACDASHDTLIDNASKVCVSPSPSQKADPHQSARHPSYPNLTGFTWRAEMSTYTPWISNEGPPHVAKTEDSGEDVGDLFDESKE